MALRTLALLGLLAFASACSDDTTVGPDDGANKIDTSITLPVKVGNVWVYRNTTFISPTSTTTYTVTAMKDTVIRGKTWTFLGDSTRSTNAAYLYRSDPSGAWYYQLVTNRELLVCRRPPMIGDTVVGQMAAAICFVLDTMITVPAGTFRCAGFREESMSLNDTRYMYFAPGAGEVLAQTLDLANQQVRRKELIAYKFK